MILIVLSCRIVRRNSTISCIRTALSEYAESMTVLFTRKSIQISVCFSCECAIPTPNSKIISVIQYLLMLINQNYRSLLLQRKVQFSIPRRWTCWRYKTSLTKRNTTLLEKRFLHRWRELTYKWIDTDSPKIAHKSMEIHKISSC